MQLYSYVVARDYGFAPNPFHGVCTLATCKPNVRRVAEVGDWVVGTGGSKIKLSGRLVFAMQVSEKLTYDKYWLDQRYRLKRPNLHSSLKLAYGDNIYHRDPKSGLWLQEPSHHSLDDGSPNPANIEHDTQTEFVLIGAKFAYWGGAGPTVPATLRQPGSDLCARRGHKKNWPPQFIEKVVSWIHGLNQWGYISQPKQFQSAK